MHWWSASALPEHIRTYITSLPIVRAHPSCVQFSDLDIAEIAKGSEHLRFLRDYIEENHKSKNYRQQLSDLLKPALLLKFGGAVVQENEMVYKPLVGEKVVVPIGPSGFSLSPAYAPAPGDPFFDSVIDWQMRLAYDHSDPHAFGPPALAHVMRSEAAESVTILPSSSVFLPLPPSGVPELQYTAGYTEEDIYQRYTEENLPFPHFDTLPKPDDLCSSRLNSGLSRRVLEVVTRKCYCTPDLDSRLDVMMGLGEHVRE